MVEVTTRAAQTAVAALLRRSLAHLAHEVPDSYRRVVAELGPLVVRIAVDGEVFAVRGGGQLVVVEDGLDGSDVRITTSRLAIVDVLDAVVSLTWAVEDGRVDVRGTLDDLVRVHDALLAYAHAAVRAPSAPGLLKELRGERGGR
jgi:hypothetical protein